MLNTGLFAGHIHLVISLVQLTTGSPMNYLPKAPHQLHIKITYQSTAASVVYGFMQDLKATDLVLTQHICWTT